MNGTAEFHYRLPMRAAGARPGSHPGASFGSGQQFAMHGRLFDYPDPRRLDLRASLRAARSEWLVRVHLQRVAVQVVAIVDVSASMQFGRRRAKLQVAADFVEALGHSAFRVGDRLGMMAFDTRERDDLFMPPRTGRGTGHLLATMLRDCASRPAGSGAVEGLRRCGVRLAGRQALVFVVSDFHWPLAQLAPVLDMLVHACVVPVVVWDEAETAPPRRAQLLAVNDAESGEERRVWLSRAMRERWRDGVAKRRDELAALFGARGMRPFYLEGEFDPEAMSRYFLEMTV
ncbi:VWA domain-containing protein [Paraburkholderia sp. MMS20-SJTR3]|uniref:VWA domain-containing protein n=1 Tax=Paraburkholderia sejongensis TaxID=2886946 RepID=A0ABS8K1U0_9BURK|nr:VWA domain-containing protein [Paraburkholderia sp. MMS20-SJTR3]MCC8396116.1 VWA domain-containing protein [Paraburkholderia sp. MMS20-SJTR3]